MSSNTVNQRVNFASTKNPLEYPDFLEASKLIGRDYPNKQHDAENVEPPENAHVHHGDFRVSLLAC